MSESSSTVRVGVIGLGQWGPNHVRNFRETEGCEVVRVCDIAESRLQLARQQFRQLETTTDPSTIIAAEDIDAVVVATPVDTHFTLVQQALNAGKNVLCEKPLAATPN